MYVWKLRSKQFEKCNDHNIQMWSIAKLRYNIPWVFVLCVWVDINTDRNTNGKYEKYRSVKRGLSS